MTISFRINGSFKNTERWLQTLSTINVRTVLESAGRDGVNALAAHTPADSGLAASSWGYSVQSSRSGFKITWTNMNVENGFPVAIMLQYGYGTGTGGYVEGRDYINPAMQPVFDKIVNDIWKAVANV